MVDRSSVRVVGPSNSFNVTWDPVNNVNYGEVFYEVSIDSLSRNDSTVRQSPPLVPFYHFFVDNHEQTDHQILANRGTFHQVACID